MKKIILIICVYINAMSLLIQGQNITITDDDSYVADSSAILDVKSTSKGVLLPRLTDHERDALYRDAQESMIIYNTTDQELQIYIDSNWYPISMGIPELAPQSFLCGISTIFDYDSNLYNTVQIGNQCWMKKNLKTTHYADGTEITLVETNSAWGNLTDADRAYCYYENDSATYANTYGALYNWYTVMNGQSSSDANPSGVRGICPAGWHLPSDEEIKELELYLGMSQSQADSTGFRGTDEGGKLKEAGTVHWIDPNTGATNESGFTALPGGSRYSGGDFYLLGSLTYFWSATEYDATYAWFRYLSRTESKVYRYYSGYTKGTGHSVRCVKD